MRDVETVAALKQPLNIATLKSVTDKRAKNIQIQWSNLVDRFATTTYTHETEDEYRNMKKSDRDRIKDVGGFVGGALKGGSRKAENVQIRQIVTLDVDFPSGNTWEKVTSAIKSEALMYSTHSHRADNERYRIIIPLNRPVHPDEYQAVSRKIADLIDIDIFDDTTYQPNRIMYWPSTPKDGEFIFKHQEGDFLDVETITDMYLDWKDTSEWPQSSRETKHLDRLIKKQENPLEKTGIIGAFCRAHTISDVIATYLSDVYEETAIEGRYTYLDGSTFGGAVSYEDTFLYSHHGTDPASLQLCNRFDLVRIHRFGDLDGETVESNTSKLPSFKKMTEFASNDKEVKKEIIRNLEEERKNSLDLLDENVEINGNWKDELEISEKGKILATSDNILLILRNDERIKGRFAFDEFSNKYTVVEPLPWDKNINRDWTDTDDAGLRSYIESEYKIVARPKITDAVSIILNQNRVNPVKSYLNSLKWDGVKRVESLLIDYLGAEDTEYTRTVTRKVFAAAVNRIYEPGCKFDNMLILSGAQGIGKSTFFSILGGDWFSDTIITVQGKEAYEQLQGVWIAEMAELTATKKADIESIKLFISKQEDHFRGAYERRAKTLKRQCILVGSTNDREFLRDRTGNRRFWPVLVGIEKQSKNVFKDLKEERDQIWAEAIELYKAKEPLYLDKKMEKEAREMQLQFTEENSKAGMIREFLDKKVPKDWYDKSMWDRRSYVQSDDFLGANEMRDDLMYRNAVCAQEIWYELLGGDIKKFTSFESREIKDILRNTEGWVEMPNTRKFGANYGRQRWFKRIKEGE